MKTAFFSALISILSCGFAAGQAQYKVLYSFGTNPSDGAFAQMPLVSDRAGNLYGVTSQGGTEGGGVIFELSPGSNGTWDESVLYSFCFEYSACPSGGGPTGLAIDSSGNLYGTTQFGGNQNCQIVDQNLGCGVAFELSPPSGQGDNWSYSVLYTFCSIGEYCEDGGGPASTVTLDKGGNIYGTTNFGGASFEGGGGTVYELSHNSTGWAETILYSFCSNIQNGYCLDGAGPEWEVTFDKAGNLYGTTYGGGSTGAEAGGTLFKLAPTSGGWTESVLSTFQLPNKKTYSADAGPVSIDPADNLYTTTGQGGHFGSGAKFGYGTVKRLNGRGVVSTFFFDGTNGIGAYTGVLVDAKRGALWGTTTSGIDAYNGNAYMLDQSGHETVLYTFCQLPRCADGQYPGGLIEDVSGNLYGTTLYGGTYGLGVVFEITP